ncbi:hypothetical protein [Luteibacter aegosomatissinici]|uniref:hypothetical protein n=1 Tax=Luteibacter aegosomatissinici TaxID=2911539 RepID=UPI001FFAF004|nr:hypothetical protein [Luteibacter aegosomatissinici]UPG92733.1 hypothetical protein L2Y97_12750 [Luteibacter aegosomatissinici]
MVGTLSVDSHGTDLVIRPVGKATGSAVLPVCASFEADDGEARRACGFIAASGGVLHLAGAADNPWVTASMPTPLGPRLGLSPGVLARGLHVARSMPADDRARLAEDIEVTLHTRLIESADSVAALVAIEFAGLHRPRPTGANAG